MKNNEELTFTDSPLMNEIHRRELEGSLDLADKHEIFNKRYNYSRLINEDIKFRIYNEKNFIFSLYGDTGIGKSTIAQYFAMYAHNFLMAKCKHLLNPILKKYGRLPIFDVSNICFDSDELLNRVSNSVPMETFIYDEAGSEKMTGTGSMREKWDKERIIKRVRVLQHNFIFCDPLIDTTKLSQLHLYKLVPYDIDYNHNLNRSILQYTNRFGKICEIGHIITKQVEVEGYKKKKLSQAEDIEKFSFGGDRAKLYDKVAKEMLEKGILNYTKQDWKPLIERWTHFNYAKDEIRAIITCIKAESPREISKSQKRD